MDNAVVRTGGQVTATITPEVAQALRLIAYSARAGDDEADIRKRITPAIAAAASVQVAKAQSDLAPATLGDAKRELTPTLALVVPTGMGESDRAVWLASALLPLSGIPADLLAIGCAEARRTVDHPAKIVPAILAAIGKAWDRRKTDLRDALKIDRIARLPAPDEPQIATPEEAAEALGRLSTFTAAPRKAKPLPTVSDYMALGLTAEDACNAVADQRKARGLGPGGQEDYDAAMVPIEMERF